MQIQNIEFSIIYLHLICMRIINRCFRGACVISFSMRLDSRLLVGECRLGPRQQTYVTLNNSNMMVVGWMDGEGGAGRVGIGHWAYGRWEEDGKQKHDPYWLSSPFSIGIQLSRDLAPTLQSLALINRQLI